MTTATVIGVLGASGGVGASSLCAALAVRAAAAGWPSVCVDGVRYGGGLDVTCGLEQETGLRWPDLAGVRGAVDGEELVARLPAAHGTGVLSFDRQRDAELGSEPVRRVLEGLRPARAVVAVDLPRPDSTLFGVLAGDCDHVVLLCGAGVKDLATACAAAPVVDAACEQTWVCLRSGDLSEIVPAALDLPVVTLLGDDPRVPADLVRGDPPAAGGRGALVRAADRILAVLLPLGTGLAS